MSYSSTVLSDHPIRYYRLDESSGTTAVDSGSQGQDGTISGTGITYSQAGCLACESDTALLLDGASGQIALPTTGLPTGQASITLEAWVMLSSTKAAYQSVICIGTQTANGEDLELSLTDTGLPTTSVHGVSEFRPTGALSLNTPHHLVSAWDGSNTYLYVDGIAYTGPALGPITFTYGTNTAFIGVFTSGGGGNFQGVIDEVAIYDYPLTSTQVLTHYATGMAPPTDYVARGFLASVDYNNNAQPINPGPYDPRGIGGTIYWRSSERAVQGTFLEVPDDTGRYVQRGGVFSTLIWSAQQFKAIATRFRLALLMDIATRFILVGGTQVLKDITTRFLLLQQSVRDITTRFRLKSADQLKDIAARFRLAQQNLKDITSRFRLMQQSLRDISTRFRLAKLNDIATRFRLAKLNDIETRFRLKSADQLKDIATRFRLAVANQQVKDIATRLRLMSANQLKDITTRFRLAKLKDVATRFRLMSASQLKDVATRFLLMQQRLKDVSSRFRLKSADQAKDVASRFRLMSANQLKDVKTRLRLMSANQLRDIAGRFILTSVGTLRADDISSRFILIAPSDVVWVSRDGKAVWDSRDDLATWKAR